MYRTALPQIETDRIFLTDGGMETALIFQDGIDLPDFAAFDLLRQPSGAAALRRYYRRYIELAVRYGTGFVLESPTCRASSDWGDRLGYSRAALAGANIDAVALLEELRQEMPSRVQVVVSGSVGSRLAEFVPGSAMAATQAEQYHREQVETLAISSADMICAVRMTYAAEAIGIVRAARDGGMPAAVAFVVESNGCLPSSQPLAEAIAEVDAATGGYPAYFIIHCSDPADFAGLLPAGGAPWALRIRGLRANAPAASGDPAELGALYAALRRDQLPGLNVMGGCRGTDHRHVEGIAFRCAVAA
ncbi:MAG: homocysteine S-methyltransferase family protein [Bryobacteraceae bacterium]